MSKNKILNIYKPLLWSYFNNGYQKIIIDNNHYEDYWLNQSEEYWDVRFSELDEKSIFEKYKQQNRPLSLLEYKKLFLSKVNIESFRDDEKVLDKIFNDACALSKVLNKLDEMGLTYSVDITGGAVRDFINKKPIKDLDVMLSIYNTFQNKEILKKMNDVSFLKRYFKTESIIYYINNLILKEGLEIEEDYVEKKQQLMILCFQDLIAETFTFTSSNRVQEMSAKNDYDKNLFKTNRLLGVFKMDQKKMKLNYPMDILLTDFTKFDFIKDFDMDICKASFSLRNGVYATTFPETSLELISRFSADMDFWADVHNKKITMNVDNMSNYSIERSIKNHLKRVEEKYPDYEFNIVCSERYRDNAKYANYVYTEEQVSSGSKGFLKRILKI